ncbi:dihydropteroate synthase [Prauserella marina]|uniref:dihydropteroate synthase n=1 Tax=Prauserella marina TaxID=530584 RepID=A0A1G6WBD5_9PSEU|nr:dihydropteroate synthase [Prauserella marina]PWV74102.1 dihydropteroate synthase [Prauserella marina]SDD63114.1 dihydropteroate synthase [Prauserella marina]
MTVTIDQTTLSAYAAQSAVVRPDVGRLKVMGVLNATPDSFWSGSRYEATAQAIAVGEEMFAEGAWAVDVGGESTRSGASPVSAEEELDRVSPIISALAKRGRVSVDTRHAEVAEAAVRLGASVVNDVSGALHEVAGRLGVGYVGMHSTAVPVRPGTQPGYDDVVTEVSNHLLDIAAAALSAGTTELWIDPGIGFGKGTEDNLHLLRRLPELCGLGIPVLLGVSRKSFIGAVTGRGVADRLPASLAVVAPAWAAGVDVIRVHDVAQTIDTIAMLDTIWGRQ